MKVKHLGVTSFTRLPPVGDNRGVKIDQQRGQSDEGATSGSGWGGEPNQHSASGQQ